MKLKFIVAEFINFFAFEYRIVLKTCMFFVGFFSFESCRGRVVLYSSKGDFRFSDKKVMGIPAQAGATTATETAAAETAAETAAAAGDRFAFIIYYSKSEHRAYI